MPVRTLTTSQLRENEAFLKALRRTGNARLAARELGVHRATYTRRRAKHPAFAAAWDAALAAADAALVMTGGAHSPKNPPLHLQGRGTACNAVEGPGAKRREGGFRTKGGEPEVVRTRSGRLQLRRAPPGRMTKAAEQAFFRAISASANIRLSAAAAGFAHSSFYARQRGSRAFAREMRLALELGYTRVEAAALRAALPESLDDAGWRLGTNDLPPVARMTADQALQLLYLHQKQVRLQSEPPHIRRRRGESHDAHSFRLSAMYQAKLERDREAYCIAEAARAAVERPTAGHSPTPALPSLDQVTGWSKADPNKEPHDPGVALFGGWRIGDWKKRSRD